MGNSLCKQHTVLEDVEFSFSGFGSFMGVEKNPTEILMSALEKWRADPKSEFKINSTEVLNVSAEDAREFVLRKQKELKGKEKSNPSVRQVLIHMGVHAKTTVLALEAYGHNNANFR